MEDSMETRSKRKWFNVIMVLLIMIIAGSGLVTVGMVQGWFVHEETVPLICGKTKGVVNIERKGIGYTLKKDTPMAEGDLVETKKGAQVQLLLEENGILVLNGNTELDITACRKERTGIEVKQGEIFADMVDVSSDFEVVFGGSSAQLSDAVFSVSAQAGSSTLNVYCGDISVMLEDGTVERVEAGEYLSCVSGTDGTGSFTVEKIQITSMNEFLIRQAQNCKSAGELCFTEEQLQEVLDSRAAEKKAALEASLNKDAAISAADTAENAGGGETLSEEKPGEDDNLSGRETETQESQSSVEEYVSGGDTQEQETVSNKKVCTIEIRCDTILNNLGNLTDGKEAYVPSNGVILETSSVEFEEGETVFEVLTRVCDYAGIQIEFSWTPLYDSYYIEGINHLYEFDCGNESGWMYKVNGWFPNYGCSKYSLEDGDVIVWCYTCNGLGADVGGPVY